MSSLLVAVALAASSLLSTPLPLPPQLVAEPAPPPHAGATASLSAADARLRKGCKDYRYSYSVSAPTADWTLEVTLRDRGGGGLHSQVLLGSQDATQGVLPYRLCRRATSPGRFSLTGVLTSTDEAEQETTVRVTETFRLRARNR